MGSAVQGVKVLGQDPVQQVMQMSFGIWVVAAMRAALECEVAEHLASGPKSAAELARKAGANEDALCRCLRALAGTGVFTEVAPGVFANTPASEVMQKGHPAHLHDMLMWTTNNFHLQTYTAFMHSVRTGETCVEKAHGEPIWKCFEEQDEKTREFNNAMTSMSAMVVPAVLETYDFSGIGTLCDVAGGHGMLLTSILKKHADLRGVLFDLPHVVQGGRQRIESMGLSGRCEAVGGDFFAALPAADSYIMKHIIHDWEESKAIAILQNCLKSMRGNGKVLLLETVLPEPNVPHMGRWIDIEMLAMPGGKERTEAEYRELLGKAGLRLERVVPNNSPLWIVEAVRA